MYQKNMSVKNCLKRGLKYIVSGVPQTKVSAHIVCSPPNELLKGRVALITGGTSGIGMAIAKSFINSGAIVVITGRSRERLDKACDIIRHGNSGSCEIYGIELDNIKVSEYKNKFIEIQKLLGNKKIDILVNNAGLRGGYLSNATEEEYDHIMDTNTKGTFFMSQMIANYMVENGIRGNILNISSASSIRPAVSAYHMSKWAIRGLTEGMARSLAPYGICVNAIAPGPTATPMLNKDGGSNGDISHPKNLLGRYATPEEIANMAVILVSDMSRTIIGDTIFMSGGAGIVTNEDVSFKYR